MPSTNPIKSPNPTVNRSYSVVYEARPRYSLFLCAIELLYHPQTIKYTSANYTVVLCVIWLYYLHQFILNECHKHLPAPGNT